MLAGSSVETKVRGPDYGSMEGQKWLAIKRLMNVLLITKQLAHRSTLL